MLIQSRPPITAPAIGAPPWIQLTTPDLRALRWRLLTQGVTAVPVIAPGAIAEFEVTDPDLHRVVIAEPVIPAPAIVMMLPVRRARRPRSSSGTGHLMSIRTTPGAR